MTYEEALAKLNSDKIEFVKLKPTDKIYSVINTGVIGGYEFSFDKKTIYYLFRDYHKLTKEQKEIYDRERPALAALVKGK